MTQRLVWNFECSTTKKLLLNLPQEKQSNDLKWESRFFWPDDHIINLTTIDDALLELTNYQQKQKQDCYYLLPKHQYNIKRRRNQLWYKPLVQHSEYVLGFGAKINLDQEDTAQKTTVNDKLMLHKIIQKTQKKGIEVLVKKESFTYKFPVKPIIKLELARIEINGTIYFSACVEGKSRHLVEVISEGLFGKQSSSDYVTFLKQIIK